MEEIQASGTRTLAAGTDFKADVKPVARAHFAQDVTWYSTLHNVGAFTSPDIGAGGTTGGTVGFQPARYGSGAAFNGDGDYLRIPATEMDPAEGTIEFWYKPRYTFGGDFGDNTDDFGLFGYWIDANNYFYAYHEPYGGGAGTGEGVSFEISQGGTLFAARTGAGPSFPEYWRVNDWVHLRFVWKADAATPRLEIYINGTLANQAPIGSYATPVARDANFYIGERERADILDNNGEGILDELVIYNTADMPTSLALGGLTSSSNEYLASGGRNQTFDFSPVTLSGQGEHLYFGSDSMFRGLNVALATAGVGTVDLQWEYWSGSGWTNLEAVAGFNDQTSHFTRGGTVSWTTDPAGWQIYSVNDSPDLYYVRVHQASGTYTTKPVEGLIKTDILLFQYCGNLTADAQRFAFALPQPTEVALTSFSAEGLDGAVKLHWRTASELNNLGFHLYRGENVDGPFSRITTTPIPGLGSSPAGASYDYLDRGVVNGKMYVYFLEDIETTGRTERHGPIEAAPSSTQSDPPKEEDAGSSRITYGSPESSVYRIISRTNRHLVIELETLGFYAEPVEDGSVALSVPGFDESGEASVPVKHVSLPLPGGHEVAIDRVSADGVVRFQSLRPADASQLELVADRRGTVRARRKRSRRELRGSDLVPREASRLVSVGFQGEQRKALIELAPLRWDGQELPPRHEARRSTVANAQRDQSPAQTRASPHETGAGRDDRPGALRPALRAGLRYAGSSILGSREPGR